MEDIRGTSTLENRPPIGIRRLKRGYILTFVLMGCLALGNYWILRAQIETGRSISTIYGETGHSVRSCKAAQFWRRS